jgi:hypothetical protein
MSIKLEVSLGEALDKLSILEIKYDKISDDRKENVKVEYEYLKKELSNYLEKFNYFYKILKKVNLEIWELQDNLRQNNVNKEDFYVICDEILNLNDSRYLVKKKLNELCLSKLKEQKGYNLRYLNIILNINNELLYYLNGAIRYYSFYYDNIYIYSNDDIYENLKNSFNDDLFININKLNNLNNIYNDQYDYLNIDNYNTEKKLTHTYFLNKKKIDNKDISYSGEINKLYDDLNLNTKIIEEYRFISNSIAR